MDNKTRQRVYRMIVYLPFWRMNNFSKVYDIAEGKSTVLQGLKYSLVTLLFGWWTRNPFNLIRVFKEAMQAIHINFSGGEDVTKMISEEDYEPRTIFIHNNLLKSTFEKVTSEK